MTIAITVHVVICTVIALHMYMNVS